MDHSSDLEPLAAEGGEEMAADRQQVQALVVSRQVLAAAAVVTLMAIVGTVAAVRSWDPANTAGWRCGSRAKRTTVTDLTPVGQAPLLGANTSVFRVASGTLGVTPWRVDIGSGAAVNAVSLVAGTFWMMNSGNSPLDGWFIGKTDKGVWLYGAVPTTVKRISAVLDSGTALIDCPAAVRAPFNQGWFTLAIPPGQAFKLVEALAGDGSVVLWATNISQIANGPVTVTTTATSAR